MGFFWKQGPRPSRTGLLCGYEHFSGLVWTREWVIVLLLTLAFKILPCKSFCPWFSTPESTTSSMVSSAGLALQGPSRKPLSWEITSEDSATWLKQQSTVQANLGDPLSPKHHRFTPLAIRTSCFSVSEMSQGSYTSTCTYHWGQVQETWMVKH